MQLDEIREQNFIKCNRCHVMAPDFDFLILATCRHYICTSCVQDTMSACAKKKIFNYFPCPCKLGWSSVPCNQLFSKRMAAEHINKQEQKMSYIIAVRMQKEELR